jgi:hypothetical protein
VTKKKGVYSKLIVATVILLNTLFSAAVLYIFLKTSNEPSTLIAAWFAFTTGELFMLSSIKKSKSKKGKGEDNEN